MFNNLIQPSFARTARLAAVDVGTNTLRLLLAEVDHQQSIKTVVSSRKMTRLGEGMIHTGCLSEAAMDRSVEALQGFAHTIRQHAPGGVVVAATSAVREAKNGAEFIARVRRETGLELSVIEGAEEARLTRLGASAVLNGDADNLLVMDIGGGSTEFILIQNGVQVAAVSVPLGVVTATERCISGAPAPARELYELDDYIRGHLEVVRRALGNVGPVRLVATAGTPTTLAAIDQEMVVYDPARINNYVLPLERVESLFDMLVHLDLARRRQVVGIEAGREELIPAGCAVLLRVMHDYQFASVTVSDWGLREGLILDLFDRMG